MKEFNTPILFVIFNRKQTAEKVFEKIREIKPKKLYVVADGPRKNRPDDIEKCKQTRDIIKVDWDCELKTLFREENVGCGRGVSGAISWLFENEEKGIILEDDVLPNSDFFAFCDDLLERYKDNDKIKAISGNNFSINPKDNKASYWYSSILHVWGWATWRRAWKDYEFDLSKFSSKELKQMYEPYNVGCESKLYWQYRANQMRKHSVDTWDYQAMFWVWRKNGLCIQPAVPLVTNIGVETTEEQTHSFASSKDMVHASKSLLPLVYNDDVRQDKQADKQYHIKYNKKALWKYPLLNLRLMLK